DKRTASMEKAIGETERRRIKQDAYNKERGITPKSIVKAIRDIIEGARDRQPRGGAFGRAQQVAEESAPYLAMSPKALNKSLAELEEEMLAAAKNLEFEKAAKIRDKIRHIRKGILEIEE